MESKREGALVGLFVLVAAGLLIVTVFLLSGTLGRGDTPYKAYFKNAGGLSPGAEVRYAGRPAAFLRGFRALYLGLLVNCVMPNVVSPSTANTDSQRITSESNH